MEDSGNDRWRWVDEDHIDASPVIKNGTQVRQVDIETQSQSSATPTQRTKVYETPESQNSKVNSSSEESEEGNLNEDDSAVPLSQQRCNNNEVQPFSVGIEEMEMDVDKTMSMCTKVD